MKRRIGVTLTLVGVTGLAWWLLRRLVGYALEDY